MIHQVTFGFLISMMSSCYLQVSVFNMYGFVSVYLTVANNSLVIGRSTRVGLRQANPKIPVPWQTVR